MGFHRCQRKGKHEVFVDKRPGYLGKRVAEDDPNAVKLLVCTQHKKDYDRGRIHVHQPRDWDAQQSLSWRRKAKAEIEAMRAQLPAEIEAAPTPELEEAT
jgi:hypothetical protein